MTALADRLGAKQANEVECKLCGHRWVGFYLPLPITAAAKIMKNLTCPMCGADSKSIMIFDGSSQGKDCEQ